MTFIPGKPIDGKVATDPAVSERKCRECGKVGTVTYQVWESSDGAFTDEKYECSGCGATWWIDGPDS